MGLLISNRLSALNKALCMPCGGLCLFTVRSFIPVSSWNVRATRQVFSSKEHNQRNNLEGMGAWTPTDFTRKGRFKGDESGAAKATEISIAPRSIHWDLLVRCPQFSQSRGGQSEESTVENNGSQILNSLLAPFSQSHSTECLRSTTDRPLAMPEQKLMLRNLDA